MNRNMIFDNRGAGVFCIHCLDTEITGNQIQRNSDAGVVHLSGHGGQVSHNLLAENGSAIRPGLLLVGTQMLQVSRNRIVAHAEGVALEAFAARARREGVPACATSQHNRIDDNLFVKNGALVRWPTAPGSPRCPFNAGTGNRQWPPSQSDDASAPLTVPLAGAEAESLMAQLGF